MNRTRPFFYSLSIHALIIALGLGAYSALHLSDEEKTKIPLKLLTYAQPDQPVINEMPEAVPPQTPPQVIAKPLVQTPVPVPVPNTPAPVPVIKPAHPAAAEPIPVTVAAPIPTKVPAPEPRIIPPAPPPPVNVQTRYEEENLGQIRAILAERLTYPKNALRLHQQGEVIVTFNLTAEKEVHGITIIQSSGFELLDDAARRLIETSASAFPKPSQTVRVTVPIGYKIR